METHDISQALPMADSSILEAGTTLQGRYEILGLRAVGGIGAVYEARDLRFTHTTRRCAVKEILNLGPDAETRHLNLRNFEREANILATLSHPSIPHIFDYFDHQGRAYLVLEFIDGEDLEEVVEHTQGFLAEERVLSWALQVCDVLNYLHTHPSGPIIFRDIKPSNIMLCEGDRIVLVDFGIAKIFGGEKKGTMVGTEGYSPPEQYRGKTDTRGDIYALGATIHHLLSNQNPQLEPPFTFHERPIRAVNPSVSPETEALVAKCLEYEVQNRFESAAEMRDALLSILGRGRAPMTPGISMAPVGAAPAIRPRWEFQCEDEVRSSPAIGEDVLYFGAYDNNLYALNAETGDFLWKYPTEAGICTTPCVDGGLVLFGSEDQVFYALSARTGRISWSCPTSGRIRSSSLAAYGHVFFGSDDSQVYAANQDTGHVIWKFQTGGPVRCKPAIVGESIVFGSEDAQVYAVDMGSGELRWKQRTSRGVVSSPCADDRLILVGSRDWHLYAFNVRSGWPVWRFRTTNMVISSPALGDGIAYVGSVDTHLYAVETRGGRVEWKFKTDGQVISSPAVHKGRVYIGSTDACLYCLDAKTGDEVWKYEASAPITSSPVIHDDVLYIGAMDGNIMAFALEKDG